MELLESKLDIKLLMTKLTQQKQDYFSQSEDEFCTLKDESEEFTH